MSEEITEIKKCRKCKKGVLDNRVKRGALVKAWFFWLPIKRYRCDVCYRKSYVIGPLYKQRDLQML